MSSASPDLLGPSPEEHTLANGLKVLMHCLSLWCSYARASADPSARLSRALVIARPFQGERGAALAGRLVQSV